jgi:hypothetical protein
VSTSTKKRRTPDSWWSALDAQILRALDGGRPAAPAEIGRRLGISEAAAISCLAMLAAEGRVRICLVERV